MPISAEECSAEKIFRIEIGLLFPARTERYVRAGLLLSFAEAKESRGCYAAQQRKELRCANEKRDIVSLLHILHHSHRNNQLA